MKRVSITAKSLAALSVLCASGCVYLDYQAYDGPKRPREEVAILHMVQDSVKTVDGVEHAGTFSIYGTRVFLLPGQHSVVFKYEGLGPEDYRLIVGPLTVTFEADAGENYHFWHYREGEMPEHIAQARGLMGFLKRIAWRGSAESYDVWLVQDADGFLSGFHRVTKAHLLGFDTDSDSKDD